jgi:hypothetical protein
LYWAVPEAWQTVHWLFTSIEPVRQLGVVCPPWQLTFEQVSAAELSNDEAPVFALYVAENATFPGAVRDTAAL